MSVVSPSIQTTPEHAFTRDELARSNERCAYVVRERAKNFYLGMRLCPQPRRSALYAVYAWMRTADDITDDTCNPDHRERELNELKQDTHNAILGAPTTQHTDWLWPAFIAAATHYNFELTELDTTLDSMLIDINADRTAAKTNAPVVLFETCKEFDRYCNAVAGVPGRLCVRIWGTVSSAEDRQITELAYARGRALQRINIARDIKQDAASNRVYIHQQLLDAHSLAATDLMTETPTQRHRDLVLTLAAEAREALQQSAALEQLVHRAGRSSLAGLTAVYEALLSSIERNPARVFERRVSVPKAKKLMIAAKAIARR